MGGGRVVGTCWLFNGHGSTEVTGALTAYLCPGTARQLWQLTWAVIAYIGHATAARALTAVTAFKSQGPNALGSIGNEVWP